MNTTERIHALEGLLARVQKNALLPRPARGAQAAAAPATAASGEAVARAVRASTRPPLPVPRAPEPLPAPRAPEPLPTRRAPEPLPARRAPDPLPARRAPEPVTVTRAVEPVAARSILSVPSLKTTSPGLMAPPRSPAGAKALQDPARPVTAAHPVTAPRAVTALRAEQARPAQRPEAPPAAIAHEGPPRVNTMPLGSGASARGTAPSAGLLELDMDDDLLRSATVHGAGWAARSSTSDEVTLDDMDFQLEDDATAVAAKAAEARRDEEDRVKREAEAEDWARLEEEARRIEAEEARLAQEDHARIAARKAEEERLAELRAEEERLALDASIKAEEERLAREAARRAEAARLEALAAQEAAARLEEERLRAEAERVAAEQAEAKLRAEAERIAAEQAETARVEADRRAAVEAEEAERLAVEMAVEAPHTHDLVEPPPASARQPRDESWPLDEALPGIDEEEEPPPESGEVSSQRKPAGREEMAAADAVEPSLELRLLAEPPPPDAMGEIGAGTPLIVEIAAEVTTRPRVAVQGDATSFLGAVRAAPPTSFGGLLAASLALGEANE